MNRVCYEIFNNKCAMTFLHFPFHSLFSKSTIPLLDTWIDQVEHDVTSPDDLWLLLA